jgi:drug/metabolite transporter (DMT)-like permease
LAIAVHTAQASVLLTTEPLWAALLAFWLLDESVGSHVAAGGAIILLACLTNALGENGDPVGTTQEVDVARPDAP